MQRILIIGDKNLDINTFVGLKYEDEIKSYMVSDMEVQIRKNDEIIKVEPVNNMLNEFSDDEKQKIPFESPKIVILTYSSDEFLREVLDKLDTKGELLFDDFSNIMSYKDILEKI